MFRSGDLSVDLVKRIVRMRDREVKLSPKEYDILRVLVQHAGKVLTHRQLLHEVWGYYPAVTTHTLETHIYRLRSKFREIGGEDDESLIAASEGGYTWMEE